MAIKTFDNGLRAICTEKADSKICSVVVHITGGCQSEKSNQSGLSEYISRLLLCGTKNYPTREALLNYAKLNGIILNAEANRESIVISAIFPNETLEWAMELLSEIVFDSNFDAATGERIKLGLLADIDRLAENHAYSLEKSTNQALYYRTGLANPKFGTTLTVERFNADTAKEFFTTLVTPKNTVISATGDIDGEEFNDYAEEFFANRLPENADYKKIKYVSEVEDFVGDLRTRNKRLNQSRIRIAFPTYGYKNAKKYLPEIIKPILEKKLYKALRLTSDYYNSLTIENTTFANNGKLEFDIVVDYENAENHLKNFVKVLKNLNIEDSISEQEFELEKNIFITNFMLSCDECLELSLINAKEVSVLKRSFNENTEKLKIEMLTVKDANKYIAETFILSKMFVSYLGHPINITFSDLSNI